MSKAYWLLGLLAATAACTPEEEIANAVPAPANVAQVDPLPTRVGLKLLENRRLPLRLHPSEAARGFSTDYDFLHFVTVAESDTNGRDHSTSRYPCHSSH